MKILLIILLLFPLTVFGWFGKDEPEEVKEQPPAKPQTCYFALHVSGKEQRVFYVYKYPCGVVSQVGIIDEAKQKIFSVESLKIVDAYEYFGQSKYTEYLDKTWPNLEALEIYKASD